MKKLILSLVVVLFILTGCSPIIEYVGQSYSPTTNVDLFYNTKDIKKEYSVMGKIDGKDILFGNVQKIQDRIVQEAKKRGADGVVISGMGDEVVGSSTQTTGENKGASWNTTSNTTNSTVKFVSADFIKYK